MGDAPQNKGEGNEAATPPERIDERNIGDFIDKLMDSEWSAALARFSDEFEAAEPQEEPTDAGREAEEEGMEIERIQRKCDALRAFCKGVIKKSVGSQDSKAYNAAERVLKVIPKIEKGDHSFWRELDDATYVLSQVLKYERGEPAEAIGNIPGVHRTSPMSKKELAELWGGDVTPKKLQKMLNAGALHCEKLSRQSFVFDKRDLPQHVLDRLRKIEQ